MSWTRPPVAKHPHADMKVPTAKSTHRGHDDKVRHLYKTAQWLKFREQVKSCNPRCQRIINGEQCTQPSKLVHHIISPKVAPSLCYDWRNVLGVCAEHHPDTAGEPLNLPAPNVYSIIQGILNATYDANEFIAKLRNPLTIGTPLL
jgi:hypothetical protein